MKQYISKEIAPWQIKLIHVAANQLHLIWKDKPYKETVVGVEDPSTQKEDEEEQDPYHQILSGFNGANGKAAVSSKNLNYDQANILIEIFHKLGFQSKNSRANQFESLFSKDRPDHYATVKQLGMLMGMWVATSREKTLESLDNFTNKIVHISHIEWLLKIHVPKMIEAIKNL
jgi:hypothetical protein